MTVGPNTILEEGGDPIKFTYTARNFARSLYLYARPTGGATVSADIAVYQQATAPGPGDTPLTFSSATSTLSGAVGAHWRFVRSRTLTPVGMVTTEHTDTFWITAVAEDPAVRETGEAVEVFFGLVGRSRLDNSIPPTLVSNKVTFSLTDPPSAPEAPTGVAALAGNGAVLLGWDGVSDRTHTRYEYRQSADGGTTWAPDWTAVPTSGTGEVNNQEYRVTGLSNGTAYTFEVRRVNDYDANGEADISPAGSVTATPTAEAVAPPAGLAAEAGYGQVWLTWTAASDPTIVGYDYQRWLAGSGWSAWTAVPRTYQGGTRYRVTGLNNDVEYRFRVRARTLAGATSFPAVVRATPRAVVPAQPMGLQARAGIGHVVLTWADPGDASIDRYEYLQQRGTAPTRVWVPMPADSFARRTDTVIIPIARTLRHKVSDLVSGTPYTFWVRARNPAGTSPASAAVTVTPRLSPPAPPANVVVIPVRNSLGRHVDVYWPPHGDATITRTEYSLDHGRTWQAFTPFDEDDDIGPRGEFHGQWRVTLLPNLDYTLHVRFVNAAGPGEPSQPVRFYTGWRAFPDNLPHPNTAPPPDLGSQAVYLGSDRRSALARADFDFSTDLTTLRWAPGFDTGAGPEVVYWRVNLSRGTSLNPLPDLFAPPSEFTLPLDVTSYTVGLADPTPTVRETVLDIDVCLRGTDSCVGFIDSRFRIPEPSAAEPEPYPGPAHVWAIVGDEQITVRWVPPVRNAESVIKYQYAVQTGGSQRWTDVPDGPDAGTEVSDERTVTVTGLTNGGDDRGRGYACHLRAVRLVEGSEETSEAVYCGEIIQPLFPRPAGIPQRPAGLTLWASGRTGGDMLLTWADPGDRTLTGYEYQASFVTGDWTPLPASDARTTQARFQFTPRRSGHGDLPTAVNVTLRAVNAAGVGTHDGVEMDFTDFQAPARPTGLTATPAGTGQVTLRWTAPPPTIRARTLGVVEDSYRGPLITGHRYTTDGGSTWHEIPDSGTGEAHATAYTVAGLPDGQAVTFHLLAVNHEGAGPVSVPVTATPQAVVPQAPTGVQATTAATAVTLTWADPGDASVTGYEVQADGGAWTPVPDGNERAHTVTGLSTGTAYTFRIRARNGVGPGPVSAAVTATPGLPNAPTGLRAVAGDGRVTLTWADPGDASVTVYEVQAGGGAWTVVSGSDAATVETEMTGLTNGEAYTLGVRARTVVGPGPAAVVTATPVHPNAPQVPRGFLAHPFPGKVTLTWLAAENGSHEVATYEYRQRAAAGGPWAPDWTPVPASGLNEDGTPQANRLGYTLTGLMNDQALRFQLRGQNAHGYGPAIGATATPSADAGHIVISDQTFPNFENGRIEEATTPDGQTYTLIQRHDVPADQRWRITVPGNVAIDGRTIVVAPLQAPPYNEEAGRFRFAREREDGLDITVTPALTGPVDLCFSAERLRAELDAEGSPNPPALQVLHYTDGAWTLLKSTEEDGLVCAESRTFSSFAVGLANQGPAVKTRFPDQTLVAGRTAKLDLKLYFTDPDDEPLTYTAGSADAAVVTATVTGTQLTLTGVAAGQTEVTVTAQDGVGLQAEQTMRVTVTAFDEARARERLRQLNREILSKQALALSDQTNRAISARVASLGQAAPAAAQYRVGGQGNLAGTLRALLGGLAGAGGAGPGQAGPAGLDRLGLAGLTDLNGADRPRAGLAGADRTSGGAFPQINLKTTLGQSSFLLPLRNAGGSLKHLTLWGQGAYTRLDGDVAQHLKWDGDLLSTQVGADLRLTPDLLAGLGLTWADGGYAYTARYPDTTVRGTYDARQMSLHPYVGWRVPDAGLGLWSTVGFGWGSVEVKDDEVGRQTSDLATLNAAVGGDVRLLARAGLLGEGTTTLTAKSEVAFVQVEVTDGSEYMDDLTIQAGRGRLLMEGVYEETLASGHRLRPFAEVGLRYDMGDTTAGVGVELGGGLRYAVPGLGLTVAGRGRGLVGHGDYREYGASGLVEIVPGAGGTGLAVRLTPMYGQAASGVQRLWTTPAATLGPRTPGVGVPRAVGQMDAEVGYGVGLEQGVVTPYGAAQVGSVPRYRIGSRWALPSGLHLTLEGRHQPATGRHPSNQGLRLQSEWTF